MPSETAKGCAKAQSIIDRDGDAVVLRGELTPLYWHISECEDCAAIRDRQCTSIITPKES